MKRKKIIIAAVLSVLVIIGLYCHFHPYYLPDGAKVMDFSREDMNMETVKFVRAVDGDTVVVEGEDGEFTVRLIGVNTGEISNCDENRCSQSGQDAYRFTRTFFAEGQEIWLEYDKGKEDRYGRTLAYLWISDDCRFNDFNDFRRYCFNAILLDNTECEARYYSPNGKYRRWLEHIEILNKVTR